MSAVLGIDGGGTRTRASIVAGEQILAFAENGSIKRLRVGAEVAEGNLRSILQEVFTQAGVSGVKAASAGVASATMPGVAEWITHDVNGILLDSPHDSAQLSQYMLRILQSPETCEMFAGAARSTVEHHGWDSVARSTMQLYETVVSNGKRE